MYKLFSVDDHIVEPADVWTSRLPSELREQGPHVIEQDGAECWVYEDQRLPTMGLNAVAGKPQDQWSMEPTRFTDMIPGCYDPKERARDLLSQGVLASVGFPSLPRFGGLLFNSFKDKELASYCVQAWNDFVLDEWCPGGPDGLFVPMVICQVWDPVLAAKELERCVAKGAKALALMDNPVPEGMPGFHTDHWDPLWAVAQEADVPVCMHIASGGYIPVPDPQAPPTGLMTLATFSGMLAMVNLLISPVCHKFPGIKIVFSEAGIGWVPSVLERADRTLARNSGWIKGAELTPTEIFRRNMYVCMIEEPVGVTLHETIGTDRIFGETDYPHSDTTFPHVQKSLAELFDPLPADVSDAITHGNAERVFNWKMADEGLISSPDVATWRATLETDPYAAMKSAHSVNGIEHLASSGNCAHTVVGKTAIEACGLPVDEQGVCPAGHHTKTG